MAQKPEVVTTAWFYSGNDQRCAGRIVTHDPAAGLCVFQARGLRGRHELVLVNMDTGNATRRGTATVLLVLACFFPVLYRKVLRYLGRRGVRPTICAV